MIRLCGLLFFVWLLCSCGSARIENAESLANAPEIVEYLLDTDLDESQRRAVAAIGIAVNAPLDFISHNVWGNKDDIKPTVTAADWHKDPVAAEKGVIFQAAKASAANQSWLSGLATWTNAIYAGISIIFGTVVTATIKKIVNQGNAMTALAEFGRDALKVDPSDAAAVKQLKKNATARKDGTKHEKELNAALNRMRPD